MTNLRTSFRSIAKSVLKIDPKGVEYRFALRCAAGVAIPLVLSAFGGWSLAGVSAAYGALVTGFASRQGVYRTRALGMMLTALALAVSGFAGILTAHHPVVNIVLAGLWAAGFGLIAAIGPAATVASMNAVVAFVLFSNAPYSESNPWLQAGAVIAGGALQTLLLVLVWPLQRFRVERHALARAYAGLAEYARHVNVDDFGLPETAALIEVRATLADPQPFGSRNELAAFEVLADEAERLRSSLAALTTDYHLLADVGMMTPAAAIGRVALAAADSLAALADAVDRGIPPLLDQGRADALAGAVRGVEEAIAAGAPSIDDARKLAGQVRAAWRAARAAANGGVSAAHSAPIARFELATAGDALDTLRANLSIDSIYARHAIRVGLAVAIAILVQRAIPLAHGQWIALTVALVLRPDFSSTFTRGFARIIGTIGGAVLASIIAAFHPADAAYIALSIFFAFSAYALFNASFVIFSAMITGYVVYVLAYGGSPEHLSAMDRVYATIIGGTIALIAYAAWPTWAGARVGDDLARLLASQARYATLILRAFLDPAATDAQAIREAQLDSRRVRSNAEMSVDQMRGEPAHGRMLSLSAAQGVLASSRRIGVASLTLGARIGDRDADHASHGPLEKFVADFEPAMAILAGALRSGESPAALPPLRDDQAALANAASADPDAHWELLVAETDLLVDSVNTIADVLRRR
jgi:uncharacterized membrane protein YccC